MRFAFVGMAIATCSGICAAKEPGTPLPGSTSGFQGWQGIKVVRGVRCPNCCDLVFPEKFGLHNSEELKLLRNIIQANIPHDMDCLTPMAGDTMDHLRRLAVEHQDKDAAEVILQADGPRGVDLGGGELSEVHAAQYLIPTLLGFTALKDLLTPGLEKHVALKVCAAAFNPGTSDDVDEKALVEKLRTRGATSLAHAVVAKCSEFAKKFGQ